MKNKKLVVSTILGAILYVVFCVILILVSVKQKLYIDNFGVFVANHRSNVLNNFFKVFTHLGTIYTMIVITIVMFFVLKNKKEILLFISTLATTGIINVLVKYVVKRVRPVGLNIVSEMGYSFPSAHTMLSIAFYGLLIYFAFKYIKNKPIKCCLIIFLSSIILAIGYSRIYLGVHYLSDVLAGFALGLSILIFNIVLFNVIINKIALKKTKNPC